MSQAMTSVSVLVCTGIFRLVVQVNPHVKVHLVGIFELKNWRMHGIFGQPT